MTPPTLTHIRRARPNVRWLLWVVPMLAAGAAVVLLGSGLFRGPEFVDRITIVNGTPFDVDVDVAGADGRVLELRYVPAGETAVVRDVIDQDESWEFQFAYGGTDAGTLRRSRSALERDDWTIEIPQEVADALERAGHEPAPTAG